MKLDTDSGTCGVVALGKHAVSTAIGVAAIAVGNEVAAIIKRRHRGLILRAGYGGIDQKLGALWRAIGLILLGKNAPAGTIHTGILIRPGHHKTTTDKTGDLGIHLASQHIAIDQEFRPNDDTFGVIALTEYAIARPILSVGFPDYDVSTVGQ